MNIRYQVIYRILLQESACGTFFFPENEKTHFREQVNNFFFIDVFIPPFRSGKAPVGSNIWSDVFFHSILHLHYIYLMNLVTSYFDDSTAPSSTNLSKLQKGVSSAFLSGNWSCIGSVGRCWSKKQHEAFFCLRYELRLQSPSDMISTVLSLLIMVCCWHNRNIIKNKTQTNKAILSFNKYLDLLSDRHL